MTRAEAEFAPTCAEAVSAPASGPSTGVNRRLTCIRIPLILHTSPATPASLFGP